MAAMAAYVDSENITDILKAVLEIKGSAFAPDYAKTETVNRISANKGTWTADRSGYVLLQLGFTGTKNAYSARFIINGKQIGGGVGGQAPQGNTYYTDLFPIAKGDVIQISTDATFLSCSCYFVPYKLASEKL